MEDKTIIKEEIINELNNVLSKMIESNKEEDSYKDLKAKQDSLELELSLLNNYHYNKNNNETIGSVETIDKMLNIFKTYYKGLSEFQAISSDDSKAIKKFLEQDKIYIENVKTKEDLDTIIKYYSDKFNKFLENKEKFMLSIKNFDKDNYNKLKNIVAGGIIIDDDIINDFRGMGVDTIIEKIYKLTEENKNYLNFILNNSKSMIQRNDPKIDYYLKLLLIGIEDYVKGAYYIYETRLDLGSINKDNFINMYAEIIKKLEEKEKRYKTLFNELKNCKNLLLFNETRLFKSLSGIGVDVESLSKEKIDELMNMDEDNLESSIAKERLNQRFKKLQTEETNILRK